MECFEVDTKIISYLENTLEDDELEAFLEHLNECEDCRNEVALYFTLIEGLKQMDEPQNMRRKSLLRSRDGIPTDRPPEAA